MRGVLTVLCFWAMMMMCNLKAQNLPRPQSAIQFGYSGELLFHPGFHLGYEDNLKVWEKTKKNGKTIQRSFHWQGSLSMMIHPKTTSFTSLEGGANFRTLKPSGRTYQYSVRVGGLFRENAGTTYIEQTDKTVSGFSFAGRKYGLISFGYGWGYDFRIKKQKPFAITLQPQIGILFPYNYSSLLFTRLELGARYYLTPKSKS